jgi:hypothetical protein
MGAVDRKDWSSEREVDVGEEGLPFQNVKTHQRKTWHSFIVITEDIWWLTYC